MVANDSHLTRTILNDGNKWVLEFQKDGEAKAKSKKLEEKGKKMWIERHPKRIVTPAIETHRVLKSGVHPSELVQKRDPSSRNSSISKAQPISILVNSRQAQSLWRVGIIHQFNFLFFSFIWLFLIQQTKSSFVW